MEGSAVNSSSSALLNYWAECAAYDDDGAGGGPSAGLLILLITHSFELLIGGPSNLWLIYHILRKKPKSGGVLPADFFPLHLALTQLIFYLVLPVNFVNHYTWQSTSLLTVVTFFNSMVIVMKPLLLCLVCVERYLAVVRPHHFLRIKAQHYRWGCLGVSWCIYILMASVATERRSAGTVCMVFLPVLAIDTACSLSVLKTLQRPPPGDRHMMEETQEKGQREQRAIRALSSEQVSQDQGGRKGGGREEQARKGRRSEMNSMKKKAFITISIIQAVLTLNYLPFIITLPMDGRVPPRTLKCQYLATAFAAAACCSYLQPLLYLHRLGRLPWTPPHPCLRHFKGMSASQHAVSHVS